MAIPRFKTFRDYWLFFAGEARRGRCPLYDRLATAIAEDESLQTLAALAQPGQPPANLLFGAVHYILLGGAEHPLAAFYPHLAGSSATPSDDPFPLFRDFCAAHDWELRQIIPARVTNTNEVRRSTLLYPSFTSIARAAKQPLSLIEIGPSAGLNLAFDRYQYRYQAPGSAETACGDLTSPLILPCEARGTRRPTLDPHPPAIVSRIGLELNPVDLTKEEDRRWLQALIWPCPTERMAMLREALAIAVNSPPTIRAGDAVTLLPAALAEVPGDAHPVVFHSHVTYQFPQAAKDALDAVLIESGRVRTISRLALEWDGGEYPIQWMIYRNGEVEQRLLGLSDPHGAWLEWRA